MAGRNQPTSSFFKDSCFGLFLSSVLASLVAAFIYEHFLTSRPNINVAPITIPSNKAASQPPPKTSAPVLPVPSSPQPAPVFTHPAPVQPAPEQPASIQASDLVGTWLPEDWYRAPLEFKEDGTFTMTLQTAAPAQGTMEGKYQFIGNNRIELRHTDFIVFESKAVWELRLSEGKLHIIVKSGFGRDCVYHKNN